MCSYTPLACMAQRFGIDLDHVQNQAAVGREAAIHSERSDVQVPLCLTITCAGPFPSLGVQWGWPRKLQRSGWAVGCVR